MSAEPDTAPDLHDDGSRVHCWCCGSVDTPDRMVHLGDHPEVHLCPSCAHFVHQQAWEIDDAGNQGPAAFWEVLAGHVVRSRYQSVTDNAPGVQSTSFLVFGGGTLWAPEQGGVTV
jgi:hypothetical protein